MIVVDSELKADLDCVSRIKFAINTEKKSSSANPLPFFVRVENDSAVKLEKEKQENKLNWKNNVNSTPFLNDDSNDFDIFNKW